MSGSISGYVMDIYTGAAISGATVIVVGPTTIAAIFLLPRGDVSNIGLLNDKGQKVENKPFLQALGESAMLYGSSGDGMRALNLIGENMSISTTYSELDEMCFALTASGQLEVVSSDPNDTVGGTGVQSAVIGYIDNGNVFHTEILNLSGTTPVQTVATAIRQVNFFMANSTGSSRYAVGDITLRPVGGSTSCAIISSGNNTWRSARIFVPVGWTFLITGFALSAIDDPIKLELVSQLVPSNDFSEPISVRLAALIKNNCELITLDVPIRVDERCVFTVRAKSVGTSTASAIISILGYYHFNP